jgi:hypothetical protein
MNIQNGRRGGGGIFNLQRVVFQRTNRSESAVKQLQHQQQSRK